MLLDYHLFHNSVISDNAVVYISMVGYFGYRILLII